MLIVYSVNVGPFSFTRQIKCSCVRAGKMQLASRDNEAGRRTETTVSSRRNWVIHFAGTRSARPFRSLIRSHAFHTFVRRFSLAGAGAENTRDGRDGRCSARRSCARCTDGSRLRQVKTGLLGKLYQVGSCYPLRRDFARKLLPNIPPLSPSRPSRQNPP